MSKTPKPICERIAAKIREMRHNAQVTQREISRRCGLSTAYMSQLEDGQCEPSAGVIVRLCRVFGVTADWLLGISEGEER